jgi:hypothetical protein
MGDGFSVFWVLGAFVVGAWCGVSIMALMSLSGGLPRHSTRALKAELRGLDLGGETVF